MGKRLAFKTSAVNPANVTYVYGVIESTAGAIITTLLDGGPAIGTAVVMDDTYWAGCKISMPATSGGSTVYRTNADIPSVLAAGVYRFHVLEGNANLGNYSVSDPEHGLFLFYWDGTDVHFDTAAPSGGGITGASSVTLTFHDSLGAAVPNVLFTILGQGSAQANTSGVAAFGLPDGTYTVAAAPTGTVLFSNATLTVSGTTALTITGHSASIPTPPSPAQTTAYGVTRDPHGSPKGSIAVTFQLRNAEQTADVYDGGEFTSTSDSSGNLEVILLKSAAYRIKTASGKYVEFTTSSDSTQPLPNVLGGFT